MTSNLSSKRTRMRRTRQIIDLLTAKPMSKGELAQAARISTAGSHKYINDLLGANIIRTLGSRTMRGNMPIGMIYTVKADEAVITEYIESILTSPPRDVVIRKKKAEGDPTCRRYLIADDGEVSTHVPREQFRGKHPEVHDLLFGRAV